MMPLRHYRKNWSTRNILNGTLDIIPRYPVGYHTYSMSRVDSRGNHELIMCKLVFHQLYRSISINGPDNVI